jgi:hypothetical protein
MIILLTDLYVRSLNSAVYMYTNFESVKPADN